MSDIAVKVENLSKMYRIGAKQEQYATLRSALVSGMKRLTTKRSTQEIEENNLWALRDVSFDIKQGEVVGIIGRNGAGKSTLLKVLAHITEPTKGRVSIYGRVGSLLEVGTGFHPELTGRDNIYLNGAILGMKRTEIERKFDEIVAFSETEKFLDTPVKRYSSGMYVRLAFAVAAHLEPEILLVDEVLSVGDAAFQKKCLGKMGNIAEQGRTVLFVSHNLGAVNNLCKSGLLLISGQVAERGNVDVVISKYVSTVRDAATRSSIIFPEDASKGIQILKAYLINDDGEPCNEFDISDQICVVVEYQVRRSLRGANVQIIVSSNEVDIFNSFDTESNEDLLHFRESGRYETRILLPKHLMKAGMYFVALGTGITNAVSIEMHRGSLSFSVSELSVDTSYLGYASHRSGLVIGNVVWQTSRLGNNY